MRPIDFTLRDLVHTLVGPLYNTGLCKAVKWRVSGVDRWGWYELAELKTAWLEVSEGG